MAAIVSTPASKRSIERKEKTPKRVTFFHCQFHATGACEDDGEVVELALGDRDVTMVPVCAAHRLCLHCREPVKEEEFATIGERGVACDRYAESAEDVEAACTFWCGGCDQMCVADDKDEDWDTDAGDATFRCIRCVFECERCHESTDRAEETVLAGHVVVCSRCANADGDDDDTESQ